MTREVETIQVGATARAAARRLADADVGSLVVCDDDEVVGIVTESDLIRVLAGPENVDDLLVDDVMSPDPVTVGPETTLERAAELLSERDFSRLPVVEGDDLVGIVTATDLSDYLPRLTERRRHADATWGPVDRLPPDSPEMAYDHPDWEFENHDSGTVGVSVGDVVRFRKELSDADVRSFAAASGDTNRLHLDDGFAEGTRFGHRIAHGVLTTGLISAALARLPGLTIYLSQELSFLGPVGVDEVATAVCRVVEDLGGEKYRLDVAVYDEEGECVVDGESVVLVDDLPAETETAAEPLA